MRDKLQDNMYIYMYMQMLENNFFGRYNFTVSCYAYNMCATNVSNNAIGTSKFDASALQLPNYTELPIKYRGQNNVWTSTMAALVVVNF